MSIDTQQSALNVEQVQGIFSLYSAGRFNEALENANALLRAYPDEGILYNLAGLINAAMLQYEPAIASLRRAIELKPDVADTHYFLGNTLLQKGDAAEALEYFERAIELRPDYVEAHSKLCEGLERSNRLEELEQATTSLPGRRPPTTSLPRRRPATTSLPRPVPRRPRAGPTRRDRPGVRICRGSQSDNAGHPCSEQDRSECVSGPGRRTTAGI